MDGSVRAESTAAMPECLLCLVDSIGVEPRREMQMLCYRTALCRMPGALDALGTLGADSWWAVDRSLAKWTNVNREFDKIGFDYKTVPALYVLLAADRSWVTFGECIGLSFHI